jgi:hypothetical protein
LSALEARMFVCFSLVSRSAMSLGREFSPMTAFS